MVSVRIDTLRVRLERTRRELAIEDMSCVHGGASVRGSSLRHASIQANPEECLMRIRAGRMIHLLEP